MKKEAYTLLRRHHAKIVSWIFVIFLLLSFSFRGESVQSGNVTTAVPNKSVKVFVDGKQIPCYSIAGNLFINANHLKYFGFEIKDNKKFRFNPQVVSLSPIPAQEFSREFTALDTPIFIDLESVATPAFYVQGEYLIFLNSIFWFCSVNKKGNDYYLKINRDLLSNYYLIRNFHVLKSSVNEYTLNQAVVKIDWKTLQLKVENVSKTLDYSGYVFAHTFNSFPKDFTFLSGIDIQNGIIASIPVSFKVTEYSGTTSTQQSGMTFANQLTVEKVVNLKDFVAKLKFISSICLQNNRNIPLKVFSTNVGVTYNNIPQVTIEVVNLSLKPVDAFELNFKCYDAFNRPVKYLGFGDNMVRGLVQKQNIVPFSSSAFTWTLGDYKNTVSIKDIKFVLIHFVDGKIQNFGGSKK